MPVIKQMNTFVRDILTKKYSKEELISFLNNHSQLFDEVVQLAISRQSNAWRAACLLNNYIENKDERIQQFINRIISSIDTKHDGHQRELLKILLKCELDGEQEGRLFNICMNIWENVSKQSSVRHTAILFIVKTIKKYPDLSNELVFFTQSPYLEPLSPGIRRSVIKLTASLNLKINKI